MRHKIQRGKKGCVTPFKEIQNLQFGEFLLLESGIQHILLWNPESWALESRIQVKESGIPFSNWNLESKFHWQRIQNRVPGIQNPRGGIKKPRMIGGLDLDQCLGPTPSAVPRNFFFYGVPLLTQGIQREPHLYPHFSVWLFILPWLKRALAGEMEIKAKSIQGLLLLIQDIPTWVKLILN